MPKKENKNKEIEEKLKYLSLDLDTIQDKFKDFEPLEYRISKFYDGKQYRQYRFISINDIQILVSPTNRLDNIEEKYKKARPLYEYLDNKSEENMLKHTTFLNMLDKVNIQDIEEIDKEQKDLAQNIPFSVKFKGNYLWQIYYSENTDKYFMIVTTEDTNYSTFFYLLKKKLESKKDEKIFVPISNIQYSSKFFKKSEFDDLENYLWLFTKDWPLIYEVYNKQNKLSIQIIGETQVYEKIKTLYKINLKTKEEAVIFYKLLKVLFILQTELPHYYNFKTNIDTKAQLEFYLDDKKIQYKDIEQFLSFKFKQCEERKDLVEEKIKESNIKLEELKQIVVKKEAEYLSKEKQISTFLECKKSFFGKMKYYFKYSKKTNKKNTEKEKSSKKKKVKQEEKIDKSKKLKENYTLEEVIENYKQLEILEKNMNNLLMDINALKLKNKNIAKKIENATRFIEEIDKHKRSIFEFWKYSNKDELAALPEGEQEEINIIKRIDKTFDYLEDMEEFGQKIDKIQRKVLNKDETDSVFIATTDLIDLLNKIKLEEITKQEIETNLKLMKQEAIKEKELTEEEFDIFGSIIEDKTKVKKIKNKKHRELPKDKFSILEINKNTKQMEYKLVLEEIIKNILKAVDKGVIPETLPVYKAIQDDRLDAKKINVFNANPEEELQEVINQDNKEINLYKINVKEGTNGVAFTNNIFYDNQNKTLPIGMDLSTKMIIDIYKIHLKLKYKRSFRVLTFDDKENDFSDINVKKVNVFEYDIVKLEDLQQNSKQT